MDGGCTLIVGYKYHCPNVTSRLLHKVPIVSLFIRIAMQALGSCRSVLSKIVSILDNNANNPFINISFGRGGSSQTPSIVNVYEVANALVSTSTLFKYVKFHYGFVVY